MRLIDADVLMDLLKKGWKTTSLDTFTHHTIDRTDVEGTPTVEAIPVEWIEMCFEKALRSANDGDDVTVDVMLDDWRKENETD